MSVASEQTASHTDAYAVPDDNLSDMKPLPAGTVCVAVAFDIETAGETPGVHAMYACGACALALVRREDGTGEIVELGRYKAAGWRVGTTRFSARCAAEFLSHANDPVEDEGMDAAREASALNNWHNLHEFPRVAPFIHAYEPADEKWAARAWRHGLQIEIEREVEMARGLLDFRAYWAREASGANIGMAFCTDTSAFDGGWLLALAAFSQMLGFECKPLPPVTYLGLDDDGEAVCYAPPFNSATALRGFATGMVVAAGGTDLRCASHDPFGCLCEFADVPAMTHAHDHTPDNDAYTIAFKHLARIGVEQGLFLRKL